LLTLVDEEVIDATIADSNEIELIKRYTPDIRVGFNFSGPKQLAWAFPKSEDQSLYFAARDFLVQAKENGVMQQVRERYYGTVKQLNYVGTQIYMKHILERLPEFREAFESAGETYAIDWRLLAAIGYQESQWVPEAKSPTGVRGLMMLTQRTAKQVGVSNRVDPLQSIDGGSKYFALLKEKIPERITEPDRTWMAMASYNIGFGHLEDARKLTQTQGGDPDKWIDVIERLPLLMRKKWYKKTRYGYARGSEAAKYVQNIRNYYDILIWMTDKEKTIKETEIPAFGILPPGL
jgi:membrane-bound lytic murein transglycosylase F